MHNHIDVYTKDPVKQLRGNNVNLNKVYNIVGSFFGSSQNVPFTKRSSSDSVWPDKSSPGCC